MDTLAILTVVRNEAARWLPSVLRAWESFADTIIALDDGSTDDTPAILQASPKVVYHKRQDAEPMWGSEAPVRQYLWQLGVASGHDWLLVLDADMVPAKDPRPLLVPAADAIAFKLFDLWSLHPPLYRWDGYWQAANHHRTWCVRNPGPAFEDEWPDRGIHCGHLPLNLQPKRTIAAPLEYSLLHMAYSDADARKKKHAQYMEKAWILNQQEQMHAASITDMVVHLAPIPFNVDYDIRKA